MTVDVIAEINAAMDDWEHAGDAFRYVAPWDEPVVRDPSGPVEWAMADGLDGYAARAMDGWLGDYRPRWITGMTHRHHERIDLSERHPWLDPEAERPYFPDGFSAFSTVTLTVRDMVEDWHQPNLIPPAEPTDPRERALAARKTRNTGPPARGLDGRPR